MTSEELLLQLIGQTLRAYEASISFAYTPQADPSFWARLREERALEAAGALDKIAGALRKNTSDFTCIDEIIDILEPLGYHTSPRHDFG